MKKSEFLFFSYENYLDISIHNLILSEIVSLDISTSIIIDDNGNVDNANENLKGQIRNNQLSEIVLDTLLANGIKHLKDKIKPLLKLKGMTLPVLRGIQNYHNPDSLKWHKDFVSPEMAIDPKKRIVTFYIVAPGEINSEFMVAPNSDGPGVWNIGLDTRLIPNFLIGHNQNLGHEYRLLQDTEINILSMLWYDMA